MTSAWVRPLKSGRWQYFARDSNGGYVWGSGSYTEALDHIMGLLGNEDGWSAGQIRTLHAYGKWSV